MAVQKVPGRRDDLARWREYLHRRGTDAAALQDELDRQRDALVAAGLADDEAFLIAVKRLGERDAASRDFAREHGERSVWRRVATSGARPHEAFVGIGLAILAALLIKLPELFGLTLDADAGFYARNLSLFVFPLLAAYFAWKRRLPTATRIGLVIAFAAAAVAANVHRFAPLAALEPLLALHLPIALWLAVAVAHAGGRWQQTAARMDFVRFSGELFLHYVLIALGGAVLMAFTFAMFESIGLNAEPFFERWMLPCGAMGAVMIAAWLVETRPGAIGHIAPLLTRLFTPLFVLLLLAFLATMGWTGRGPEFHRELLVAFDLLLAVVVGLLLYAIAGRDPAQPPGWFDWLQIALVVAALLVDAIALWTIAARIGEYGFTPNRTAALGENLILLLNLAGSAALHFRFVGGRGTQADLERWQTRFLPVYAVWAAIVVVIFPLAFDY